MQRELALLCSSDLQTITRRLLIPLLLLPTFFAVAIGSSVPAVEREMLGFLSILACIWMGASLTLMAIVDEREAYNQERLLFLRIGPYVTAKMIVLGGLAIVQCLLFFLLLWALRTNLFDHDAMFNHPLGAVACLVPVSLAATGLGLVISALSGRSRPMANFILPLVMMAQIVFSTQIVLEGNRSLEEAYRDFRFPRPSLTSDAGQETRPPLTVVAASYLTLSRSGDIALRSFAYHQNNPPDNLQPRCNALAWLGTLVVLLPTGTALTLWLQERPTKLPEHSD